MSLGCGCSAPMLAMNPWWRSKGSIFHTGPAVKPSHAAGPYVSRYEAEETAPIGFFARDQVSRPRRSFRARREYEREVTPVEVRSGEGSELVDDAMAISANPCGCERRYNPELLIVRNPCGRRVRANPSCGKVKLVLGRGKMRRKRSRSRNPRIHKTIRFGGQKIGWKRLVKRFGVKKAKGIWRKSKKYLGRCRIAVGHKRRKSRRSRRHARRSR